MKKSSPGKALIVDDEKTYRLLLKNLLLKLDFQVVEAENGQQAIDMFQCENPSIVFMDVVMPVLDGYQATRRIKAIAGTRFVPVIFVTAASNESAMAHCIEAGGDDFLVKPYDSGILQGKIRSLQRIAALNREVQGMYSMIHREQEVAESVFVNAIQSANIDNPCLRQTVRPASIFSGDMVLSAYTPARDLFFLIGDFTGHGLLAALGAMPVSEVFRAMTAKGFGPEAVLLSIHRKLRAMLPTGMFFAVQLVVVDHDLEHLRVFNAGMPELLIVDGCTHRIKQRLASNALPLGVDIDCDAGEMLQHTTIAPNDRILMYSDGLIEARNRDDEEFGDKRLEQAIDSAPAQQVFDHLLEQLDQHCEKRTQADDVTLVEITCAPDLLAQINSPTIAKPTRPQPRQHGDWHLSLRFDGSRLRETDPVPMLVSHMMELENQGEALSPLFGVLAELYATALEQGVLALDAALKSDAAGLETYFMARQSRLARLDSGYISFDLRAEQGNGQRSIIIGIEAGGAGFALSTSLADNATLLGDSHGLCETLAIEGNTITARFSWSTN